MEPFEHAVSSLRDTLKNDAHCWFSPTADSAGPATIPDAMTRDLPFLPVPGIQGLRPDLSATRCPPQKGATYGLEQAGNRLYPSLALFSIQASSTTALFSSGLLAA